MDASFLSTSLFLEGVLLKKLEDQLKPVAYVSQALSTL